jgi:hypothetical protein
VFFLEAPAFPGMSEQTDAVAETATKDLFVAVVVAARVLTVAAHAVGLSYWLE